MSREAIIEKALLNEELAASEQCRIFRLLTVETGDPITPYLHLVDSNYDVIYDGILYARFPFQFSDITISCDGTIDKANVTVANVSRDFMYYIEYFDGLRNRRITVKSVFERFVDLIYSPQLDGTVTTAPNPEADPDAYIEDEYIIDTYTANEKVIQFQLDPVIDLNIRLPRRVFTPSSCYWQRFGDTSTCGYNPVTANVTGHWAPGGTVVVNILPEQTVRVGDYITLEGVTGIKKVTAVYDEPYPNNYVRIDSPCDAPGPGIITHVTCNKSFDDCKNRQNQSRFGGFPGIRSVRYVRF